MMKRQRTDVLNPLAGFLAISVLLITFAFLTNARAADTDVSEEVSEAASAIADYSVEQKDAAMEKAKEMMDALDDRIHVLEGKLEENWGDMKEGTKEKYQASLEVMREKREDLSKWYDSMKDSSGDAWQDVKTGFAESYQSLVQYMKDAKEEMAKE